MQESINRLIESEEYYYIDYIPHNPVSSNYLELEEYYIKTYLGIFADKISRVMLQLMWQYPCCVCLGEASKPVEEHKQIQPFTDIRNYSPEQLDSIIKTVIKEDFNFFSILFFEKDALLSVGGEFQVVLYQPSNEMISFTKLLCEAEGLFLKHKLADGTRVLV